MKKLLFILILIIPTLAFSQSTGQTWTEGSPFLNIISVTKPTYDSSGNLTHFIVRTNNSTLLTNNTTGAVFGYSLLPVSFDLITMGQSTITAGGATVTYVQLAQLMTAVCLQQNPLPTFTPAVTTNNAAPVTP